MSPPLEAKKELTYLALGDSYTIGESVPEEDRWSFQLARMLQEKGKDVTAPDVIAQTGWTTSELSKAIKASGNKNQYKIVSLLIGVNNQYRGQPIETFQEEFSELLATAISFAGGDTSQVLVLSIPDWGVTPFAASLDRLKVAREINAFNAVAEKECKRVGIVFINITEISRTAVDDLSMIATDQLHFSGKMYELWAKAALPVVLKMLE